MDGAPPAAGRRCPRCGSELLLRREVGPGWACVRIECPNCGWVELVW